MLDTSLTAKARRQVGAISGLAVAFIFVSGLFQGQIPFIISVIGAVAAVAGWVYAMLTAARARQTDWIGMLVLNLVIALALAAYAFSSSTTGVNGGILGATQLGLLPLAYFAWCYASLGAGRLIERGLGAFFGGWGLLVLVIGGTLVGGAIGTNIGAGAAYITALGFRLYAVSGVLGLFAWVIGMIVAIRTRSWGWATLVILLPAIGAFMFGLFGPTRQDVLMAQENARQRKAVGLN